MFVIGLTGGIGCGKSTAASVASRLGLPVLDADGISRDVTAAGGAAIPEIVEAFGPTAVDASGALDREAMSRRVFRDRNALDILSSIVHRHVLAVMGARIDRHREQGTRALVLDVPIPVREGFVNRCSQVWVVWADDDLRVARLAARGMDPVDVRRRMAMQMSRDEYFALADRVLWNNGDREALERDVEQALREELTARGIRPEAKAADQPTSVLPSG